MEKITKLFSPNTDLPLHWLIFISNVWVQPTLLEKNMSLKNSTIITTESWFIPFDTILIVCSVLVIVLAALFFVVIISDRTCHTVPMMLIGNTYLTAFVDGCILFSTSIFVFQNDLKQLHYPDTPCIFRGYMQCPSCTVMDYSFVLQASYRYEIVVYPSRLLLQSFRFQLLLIGITWLYGYTNLLAFIFTGDINYNAENQICQFPLRLSFSLLYATFCIYLFPLSMIILNYLKLVRYVKETSKRVISVNILCRAQRELKMVQRIVMLIIILMALGVPCVSFIFILLFTPPPRYHFRIAFTFAYISMIFVMIALFQSTVPLKASIMKKLNVQSNTVAKTTP